MNTQTQTQTQKPPKRKLGHLRTLLEEGKGKMTGTTGSMASFAQLLCKTLRSSERVCIFIDNSNLFWALRLMLESKRLDYVKLRKILAQDRQSDVRFYYSEPQNPLNDDARKRLQKQRGFYDFLEKTAGYTMIKLPLWERTIINNEVCSHCHEPIQPEPQQVAVEKGLDCEIVFDMCKLSQGPTRFDKFILVAGDQDYARTIKKIRIDTGIQIDVAFFEGPRISPMLIKEASQFINLNQHKEELFAYRPKPCYLPANTPAEPVEISV